MMPERVRVRTGRRTAMRALALCIMSCGILQAPHVHAAETASPCDASTASAPGAARLIVNVTGAHSARGSVVVTLYGADRSRFLAHHGAITLQRVPASASAAACFTLAAPGLYAVAVYHDENDNRKFDRTLLGLPAEGYGFSNNAPTPFGLPSFDAVKFDAAPGITRMSVRLRY